jgi:hypothetical protein
MIIFSVSPPVFTSTFFLLNVKYVGNNYRICFSLNFKNIVGRSILGNEVTLYEFINQRLDMQAKLIVKLAQADLRK